MLKKKESQSIINSIDNSECGVYDTHITSLYYKGTGENITGGKEVKRGV